MYAVGDTVRLEDGTLAKVVEVIPGAYSIEPGQSLGGGPSDTGGEMSYRVKLPRSNKTQLVRDREVWNPPKK